MRIRISGNLEYTEVWNGTFYKKLSDYPSISDWEVKTIQDFIAYENQYGRKCDIECDDPQLLEYIHSELKQPEKYAAVQRPRRLTECNACPIRKGCETRFVCHTTSLENAVSILKCGSLLSPVKARGLPASELAREARNTANDPEDYFAYIMFAWGNCQAGDRLVMERKLGRFPTERDLSVEFTPGIRFFFRYDHLVNHPRREFDGVLPFKIKDEVVLEQWVDTIVVSAYYREQIAPYVPVKLEDKMLYVENDCKDIWEWSEKVYSLVESK